MKIPNLIESIHHILRIHEIEDIQIETPILYKLSKTDGDLWITGTQHTQNAQNPQIAILKAHFINFIKQNYKNPILCLEGHIPAELENEEESIRKYGEKAVLILMAQKHGIKIVSVEPTQTEISEWALQLFPDPLAHAVWATLNVLWHSPDFLEKALPKISDTYGFTENPKEFFKRISDYLHNHHILEIPDGFEKLSTTSINNEIIKKAQEPNDGPFQTNKAGSAINLARDYGLFKNTLETMEQNKHNGTFAWFGLNHVLAITPAFETKGYKKSLFIAE